MGCTALALAPWPEATHAADVRPRDPISLPSYWRARKSCCPRLSAESICCESIKKLHGGPTLAWCKLRQSEVGQVAVVERCYVHAP